jgi:hypothetical protein
MGKGFPGPEPDHPRGRRKVARSPLHWTSLLLHHPESPPSHSPVKVVVQGSDVRMSRMRKVFPKFVELTTPLDVAQGVTIPAGEIQVFCQGKVIKLRERPHEIVSDESTRRICPEDIYLKAVEGPNLV